MRKFIAPKSLVVMGSICLLLLAFFSITLGDYPINFTHILSFNTSTADSLIFWELRVPRTLVALIAGAALGACGATMQGYLRNPLASPGLLGNASGAALASVIVLYFGFEFPPLMPIVGMLGSFIALGLVLLMAGNYASITVLILSGVAVNTICVALIALLLNFADSPWAMRDLYLWIQGSLSSVILNDIMWMICPLIVGFIMLIKISSKLDALTFGDDTAVSLGINMKKLRWQILTGVSLVIGSIIPVTGMIGFIGLVVPHILRPIIGYQPSKLIIPSAIFGAIVLLGADLIVRGLTLSQELRIGVLTSIVGGPFFIYLLVRHRKELF